MLELVWRVNARHLPDPDRVVHLADGSVLVVIATIDDLEAA